eukprot:TRINITY_DN2391_c0_g1_i6.p1 TRINITY_DN2391_c0_g1~~TRINITY_DN2391_c0_g1_i6.p1  ORF type:complete len:470 (-),score=58.76 TRINITY_DN2391_c0_g1_i6:261-1670(-)
MRSVAGFHGENSCSTAVRVASNGRLSRASKYLRVYSQNGVDQSVGEGKRRVVITGMSVVSPLGHEVDEFFSNLLEGRSGISQIEGFDCTDFSTRIAGEIKNFETNGYVSRKWDRRLDKCIKYTLYSGKKALEDAGIQWDSDNKFQDLDPIRCGILVGSAMGGFTAWADAVHALHSSGHRKMNPFCIPFSITNMGGAMLAMDLGFMGPNYPISTACATGNHCILSAADFIQRNQADIMLAGASDAAITPAGIGGFIACKALSKENDCPESASRPWDVNRDGFVMGEGSAVLVLEQLEHAQKRGARIYAEVAGGAFSCDAHSITDPLPGGEGVNMCIRNALQNSGVKPEEVDYVNAHATSTKAGDMAEYYALRDVLMSNGNSNGHKVSINSTKSMIGHALGAAGALEAVATVKSIHEGVIHPNLNLESPEEGLDLDCVIGTTKQQKRINVAISNSFGFGGHISCAVFKAFS